MSKEFTLNIFTQENAPSPDLLKDILKLNVQMLGSIGGWENAKGAFAAYGMVLPEGVSVESGKLTSNGINKEAFGEVGTEIAFNKSFIERATFDEAVFQQYQNNVFANRLKNQGHHVFVAIGENNKPIAIASGDLNSLDAKLDGKTRWETQINAAKAAGGEYFRILNVAVDESVRRQGFGTELLRQVGNVLADKNVAVIEAPVSRQGQEKGLDKFYETVLQKFAVQGTSVIDAAGQKVLTVTGLNKAKEEAKVVSNDNSASADSPSHVARLNQQRAQSPKQQGL